MLATRMVLMLMIMLLVTSGCVPMAAAPVASIGTTVASGKTPVDHVVSAISGKDCSVRRNRQGLTYCVEDEQTPPVRVVCYHTLGDVSCYDHPNPFNGRQRAIVEDLGVNLVPFATGNPIPPGLLPEPLQQTDPSDAVEYELERPDISQVNGPQDAAGQTEGAAAAGIAAVITTPR